MADREDQLPILRIHANPSWEETSFRDELESRRQRFDLRTVPVVEEPPEAWEGETGLVTPTCSMAPCPTVSSICSISSAAPIR